MYKKYMNKSELALIIILYTFLGIVMILLAVGNVRYKYPYLIILLPFAANYISLIAEKIMKKDIV